MRLDFKILWIDDQPKHVASFEEGLKRKLRDIGFRLVTTSIASLDQINKEIADHVHNDLIDLVLVDFDLGSGSGGEDALQTIRRHFPFKDIVFYSATDTAKLRQLAYEKKVDGIHFSTRLTLTTDAFAVINNMLRKVLDLDHMRGIVMSATSDIDFMVEESLSVIYSKLGAEQQQKFLQTIQNQLREKLKKYEGELEKAASKNTLQAALKLKHLFSAADRLDCLITHLSEGWTAETESMYLDQGKKYREDVVPRRNKLAHVMLREVDGKLVLKGGGEIMSQEDMTRLRCELMEHRDNFSTIAVLLDVPLD
ncbi:hypothetical protein [Herbaspirillum seropedicae]|uniref:hypothetical protein n=1 Tax=Herbaspirillum seropedicae TaxID=964 RepID=UPI002858FAC8|nr:hypothetical protein [Herbaspirillum seropedicae]MDR6397272.1 DNA-binding NarL/FixJ family response regulator [Herbaspirillum seropedicae]